MPRLSDQDRAIVIGLLHTNDPLKQVVRTMGVCLKAIRDLHQKFQQTGQVKDLPRSGRLKITTVRKDRLIVNRALRRRTDSPVPSSAGSVECHYTAACVARLINTMRRRCQAVISRRGGYTRY